MKHLGMQQILVAFYHEKTLTPVLIIKIYVIYLLIQSQNQFHTQNMEVDLHIDGKISIISDKNPIKV